MTRRAGDSRIVKARKNPCRYLTARRCQRQPFELRRVDAAREEPVRLRRLVREELAEVLLGEVLGVGLEELRGERTS